MRLFKDSKFVTLESFTLVYLGLPHLFFIIGWLRWEALFPVLMIFLWGCNAVIRQIGTGVVPSKKDVGVAFFISTIWCVVSGVGGVFAQSNDYHRRNALMHDLVASEWPVFYQDVIYEGQLTYLHYYFGYYLPPAWLSNLLGIQYAEVLMLIWTVMGVTLALLWVKHLAKLCSPWLLALFPFLGGLDVFLLLYRIVEQLIENGVTVQLIHLIFYQGPETSIHFGWEASDPVSLFTYWGNSGHMLFVPHQVLAGWLPMAVFIKWGYKQNDISHLLFWLALTPIWGIFACLGIIPFFIHLVWKAKFQGAFSLANTLGGLLLLFYALFYLAHSRVGHTGFIWEYVTIPTAMALFGVVISLEWLPFVFLIFPLIHKHKKQRTLLFAIIIVLTAIPLYKLGGNNDWMMRVSIPALFALWVLFLGCIPVIPKQKSKVFLVVFVLVAVGQAHAWAYQLITTFSDLGIEKPPSISQSVSIERLKRYQNLVLQYRGSQNSFFYEYLMEQRETQPEKKTTKQK